MPISPKTACGNPHGVMVNYLYELSEIEANHFALMELGAVATSKSVQALIDDEPKKAEKKPRRSRCRSKPEPGQWPGKSISACTATPSLRSRSLPPRPGRSITKSAQFHVRARPPQELDSRMSRTAGGDEIVDQHRPLHP